MPSVSFAALSKRGQLPQQTLLVVSDLWQRRSCTDSSCRSVTNRGRVTSECSPLIQSLLSGQPGRGALTHTIHTMNQQIDAFSYLIQQPHTLVICICTYWAFLLFFSGWCFTHQGSDCWRWRSRNWACCTSGWVLAHTGWYGGLLRAGIQWRTWSNPFNSGRERRPEPHFHCDWAPQQACSRRQDGRH